MNKVSRVFCAVNEYFRIIPAVCFALVGGVLLFVVNTNIHPNPPEEEVANVIS